MSAGVSLLSVCIQQVREVGAGVSDLSVCIQQVREVCDGVSHLSVRIQQVREVGAGVSADLSICILLGPPGCAQVFPYLSPGLLDFFGGIKTANKPRASRNYTQDQLSVHTAAEN